MKRKILILSAALSVGLVSLRAQEDVSPGLDSPERVWALHVETRSELKAASEKIVQTTREHLLEEAAEQKQLAEELRAMTKAQKAAVREQLKADREEYREERAEFREALEEAEQNLREQQRKLREELKEQTQVDRGRERD